MDKSSGKKKSYTLEEVSKHREEGDCWIIINDRVYDVSVYMYKHPGGAYILQEFGGAIDATEQYENTMHSRNAKLALEKYFIGRLDRL